MSVRHSNISRSSKGGSVKRRSGSARRSIRPVVIEMTAARTRRVVITTTTRATVANPDQGVGEALLEGRNPNVPARFSETTMS